MSGNVSTALATRFLHLCVYVKQIDAFHPFMQIINIPGGDKHG